MPPLPAAERLRRILVLAPWVIVRGDPTVEEVCDRFEMTPGELAADIDLLMVCGLWPFTPADHIEASIDAGRVTIRMPQVLDRPPRLTRAEALALLVVGRAVADLPGLEDVASLRSALVKLADAVTPKDVPEAEGLAERIAVSLDAPDGETVVRLRAAVEEHGRVRITYFSGGRDEMTEREIDPLLVFGAAGAWYVAAVDHASGEERLFRADRIRDLAPTGEVFTPPGGFDPSRYTDGPLYTPSAEDLVCVIEVEPSARWLQEVVAPQEVEDLGDGRVRLRVRTRHLPWLVRVMLSAGTAARAIEPPALAGAVRDEAARALAAYGS